MDCDILRKVVNGEMPFPDDIPKCLDKDTQIELLYLGINILDEERAHNCKVLLEEMLHAS